MKIVEYLHEMASRALSLSRKTHDLSTSRELRIMGDDLIAMSQERQKELRDQPKSVDGEP